MNSSTHTDTSARHSARLGPRRTGLLGAAAALAATLALPTAAGASQVVQATGGLNQLTVTAPSGEVNRIHVSDDGPGFVRVRDAVPLRDGAAPCTALSSLELRCAADRGTTIVVRPGDRDDRVDVASELRVGIEGGAGNDTYAGGMAASSHVLFFGDAGVDTVSYAGADAGVEVRLADGVGDGRDGDFDDIRDAEKLIGSRFGDNLAAAFPSTANAELEGGLGDDVLTSSGGRDVLVGGPGVDTISSGSNVDRVDASGRERDTIDCGSGSPDELFASLSGESAIFGCERVVAVSSPTNGGGLVGTPRLTPAVTPVAAGETARVALSWRHPRAWRQLRRIVLRFRQGRLPVGEVVITPHGRRVRDRGDVAVVPHSARILRKGRTVSARLALRLHRRLAARKLTLDVEAVDVRGRRQINRNAGAIRVASPDE